MKMRSIFYFVAYELSIEGERRPLSNVILQDQHPLIWASIKHHPSIETYLLFWQEIPESVALNDAVRKVFSVEGAIDIQEEDTR